MLARQRKKQMARPRSRCLAITSPATARGFGRRLEQVWTGRNRRRASAQVPRRHAGSSEHAREHQRDQVLDNGAGTRDARSWKTHAQKILRHPAKQQHGRSATDPAYSRPWHSQTPGAPESVPGLGVPRGPGPGGRRGMLIFGLGPRRRRGHILQQLLRFIKTSPPARSLARNWSAPV